MTDIVVQVPNPETDGPIHNLYVKVKKYLPDVEGAAIDLVDKKINLVAEECDKVVASASEKLKKGREAAVGYVPSVSDLQKMTNTLTDRVLSEIESRLDLYITRFESKSEAAAPSGGAAPSREGVTGVLRVKRILNNSRRLNSLVLSRVVSEVSRYVAVPEYVKNIHMRETIPQIPSMVLLETMVVRRVATDLFSELVEKQMANLKVTAQNGKNFVVLTFKNVTNPEKLRDEFQKVFGGMVDFVSKVVDNTLKIKLERKVIQDNLSAVLQEVLAILNKAKTYGQETVSSVEKSSKDLYLKVVRSYKVQKILMSKPIAAEAGMP